MPLVFSNSRSQTASESSHWIEEGREKGMDMEWGEGGALKGKKGEKDWRRINKRETRADTEGEMERERERNEGGSEGK